METLGGISRFAINPGTALRSACIRMMCSSSSSGGKVPMAKNPELKLDFGTTSTKQRVGNPLDDWIFVDGEPDDGLPAVRSAGGNGSGSGSGDGDGNGEGGDHGGLDDSSFDLECQLSRVDEDDDQRCPQVRSFCCLSVDPVFDGTTWTSFHEGCEFWRPCLLPCEVQAGIMSQMVAEPMVTDVTLARVTKQIEEWYHGEGYTLAKVVGFTGVEQGVLCCKIAEGTVTNVRVHFRDENENCVHGKVDEGIIRREFPRAVEEGMPYNAKAIKVAMQRMFQLHLFEKIAVDFSRDAELGGVTIDFTMQERSPDGCHFQTGLSFIATDTGRPILPSVRPAATLSVEHRNISGKNRTLQGYIHANDLLSPQDDSRFKLEYVHPYVDGVNSPRDRVFRINCYNSRKLAAVYFNPRTDEHVPALWVDRAGLKMNITEKLSRASKLSYGFVIEEVATKDSMGTIQEFEGDSGVEHVPFFQAKITRENTRHIQGLRVGAYDTCQIEQGIGFGSKASFFNKHQLAATRYIALNPRSGNALPMVIVRARYGGIVGDNPRYRAFTSGGPYSLRGSNPGELGNCTSFLELMGELRVPLRKNYAYGFVESFTDLDGVLYRGQSLHQLARAASSGVLMAVGVKIDDWRTEFVFDCGTRSGSLKVQLGERL